MRSLVVIGSFFVVTCLLEFCPSVSHFVDIRLFVLHLSHSSFLLFFKFFLSGIVKSTEWSTIPVCPNLLCFFFNSGNTEGTKSSKKNCLMFVYVFCTFVSGLILLFWNDLWVDDLRAV